MKCKLTMPVEALSGSMSKNPGLVAFVWRGLNVFRAWVSPRNPKSAEQLLIRNIITQAAQAYQSVTPNERTAWAEYATNHPEVIFDQAVTLPEIAMYVRVNTYRLIDAVGVEDAAPTELCDFVASDIATVAYDSGTTHLTFDVTHNAAVVTNKKWLIKITPSMSSPMKRVKEGDYRLALGVETGSIIPVTATPQTIDLTAPKFGNWSNQDTMSIKLIPLSPDYDPGTPYEKSNLITVT